MRFQKVFLAAVVICGWGGIAWAGFFREDENIRGIKYFGAIQELEGEVVVSTDGYCEYVPLGTQLRLNRSFYLTYDHTAQSYAVQFATEVNRQSEWQFVTESQGRLPLGSGSHGKRYTKTSETRVQARTGPLQGWYLGYDSTPLKKKIPAGLTFKNVTPPPEFTATYYRLVLVPNAEDALIFTQRVSGVYKGR